MHHCALPYSVHLWKSSRTNCPNWTANSWTSGTIFGLCPMADAKLNPCWWGWWCQRVRGSRGRGYYLKVGLWYNIVILACRSYSNDWCRRWCQRGGGSRRTRLLQAFWFIVGTGHCPMISKYGLSLSKAVGPIFITTLWNLVTLYSGIMLTSSLVMVDIAPCF